MLSRDLINFIQTNKLEDIMIQTEWVDQLVWSVFLDEEHLHEIEYSLYFNGDTRIRELIYSKDEDDLETDETKLNTEQALKIRGLAE